MKSQAEFADESTELRVLDGVRSESSFHSQVMACFVAHYKAVALFQNHVAAY